jgi:hypothetical protein
MRFGSQQLLHGNRQWQEASADAQTHLEVPVAGRSPPQLSILDATPSTWVLYFEPIRILLSCAP